MESHQNTEFDKLQSYDMIAATKYSIAEKNPIPSLGIDTGSPWNKTNDLTTEPKIWLSDALVRD